MYIYKIIFGFIPKALPGTFISVAFNGQNPVLPPSDTQLEGDLATEGVIEKDITDIES